MSQGTKPVVVVTRRLPDVIETRMMELFDARLNLEDRAMTPAELIEAVKTAEILVPTVTDRIDARVLSQAGPQLNLIASFGTGVDHIDLATARQRNITVTNTPGVLTEDTADMTMALILAVSRRVSEGERLVRAGEWQGWARRPCSVTRSTASASALSGWGGSVRRWRVAPEASACRCTTTTGVASIRMWRRNLKQPIGRASIRCSPGWMLFPSTVPTPQRPIIFFLRDAFSCFARSIW